MKKLVVLTGSGISAESGLKTFREQGGLWENYDVMQVASYEGWVNDPSLVMQFYNERRRQLKNAKPNEGHLVLAELEKNFDVHIITQNVDDLHEKAGSSKILHLHGILTKARSTGDDEEIIEIGYNDLNIGDTDKKGYQLRPHIVWFGEPVPLMEQASSIASTAEIFIIIGTSLVVYPAAGLLEYVPKTSPVYIIDPNELTTTIYRNVEYIREKASSGTTKLKKILLATT